MAEIEMIEEIESQVEYGMRTLTKKDRNTIASFLRRFNRVNQRLGSEVEQRVKRLAPIARYQQKTVSQLAKLIRKKVKVTKRTHLGSITALIGMI